MRCIEKGCKRSAPIRRPSDPRLLRGRLGTSRPRLFTLGDAPWNMNRHITVSLVTCMFARRVLPVLARQYGSSPKRDPGGSCMVDSRLRALFTPPEAWDLPKPQLFHTPVSTFRFGTRREVDCRQCCAVHGRTSPHEWYDHISGDIPISTPVSFFPCDVTQPNLATINNTP